MRVLINVMVLSLTLGGVGCVLFLAKETRYLLSATDRATQEEVRQHLGQPLRVTSNKLGEPPTVFGNVWKEAIMLGQW